LSFKHFFFPYLSSIPWHLSWCLYHSLTCFPTHFVRTCSYPNNFHRQRQKKLILLFKHPCCSLPFFTTPHHPLVASITQKRFHLSTICSAPISLNILFSFPPWHTRYPSRCLHHSILTPSFLVAIPRSHYLQTLFPSFCCCFHCPVIMGSVIVNHSYCHLVVILMIPLLVLLFS
jgi:hypothetical protein